MEGRWEGKKQGGAEEQLDSLRLALHRPLGSRQKGQGTLGGDLFKETNGISRGSDTVTLIQSQYGRQQALISSCTGVGDLLR